MMHNLRWQMIFDGVDTIALFSASIWSGKFRAFGAKFILRMRQTYNGHVVEEPEIMFLTNYITTIMMSSY